MKAVAASRMVVEFRHAFGDTLLLGPYKSVGVNGNGWIVAVDENDGTWTIAKIFTEHETVAVRSRNFIGFEIREMEETDVPDPQLFDE